MAHDPPILREAADSWIKEVRQGRFEAMPPDLDWDGSSGFAHLVDGYRVSEAMGWGNLHELAAHAEAHWTRSGHWSGTGLQLWCLLFYEYRRYRHYGSPPVAEDMPRLAQLYRALRECLVATRGDERAALIAAISAH